MNTTSTTILEKIKRLLALSQSSNVHEAAAAMAAAAKLMAEHDVAEAELESSPELEEAPELQTLIDDSGARLSYWKAALSHMLVKAHDCRGFTTWTLDNKRVYRIAGRPSQIATVRYLYAWLVLEITRLTEVSGFKGVTSRNSFRIGAVDALREGMFKAREKVRKTASGAALVRIDEAAERIAAILPQLRNTSGRLRVDRNAREAGRRAGESIHGGASLGAQATRLLGR